MGSPVPYRVDLFDDEVDSIRTFDPDTQRSLYPVPEVRLLPGREFPLDDAARAGFRARWRERLEGDPTRSRIYKDIGARPRRRRHRVLPAAVLRPDRDACSTTSARDAALVLHGEIDAAISRFWTDTRERHRFLQHDPERPILPPEAIFLRVDEFFSLTGPYATLALRGAASDADSTAMGHIGARRQRRSRLDRTAGRAAAADRRGPHACLLVAESEGRRESLLELLRDHRIDVPSVATLAEFEAGDEPVAIAAAPLARGFVWRRESAPPIAFITEAELFAATPALRRRRRQEAVSDVEALIKDLSELTVGDPVVHANHGIGRYRGLVNLDLGDGASEFLHLDYADDATLYVPVAHLHLISRYTGVERRRSAAAQARLGPMGQGQAPGRRTGARHRGRAAEPVRPPRSPRGPRAPLLGARLRGLRRRLRLRGDTGPARRHPCRDPGHDLAQADGSPGLRRRRLRQDRGRVARRLRRGDRRQAGRAAGADHAAGRAALTRPSSTASASGRSRWPSCRAFARPRRRTAALAGMADGSIDIVVGTHKLLSKDVQFKRLGLLVIDEEHRFGVRHKEAIKALRSEVDVLTLTATPIPRTLGMALGGPARPERDRHRAAAAAGDQDLRARRGQQPDPRGRAARAQARRAGLLPAQRGRDDPAAAQAPRRAGARGAHRGGARPDARARTRAGDARLRRAALQPAAVLDDHRNRHRRGQRQHHRDQPRRQVRPRAAAPVARPRRPLAPPGLCLPDGARHAHR